MRKKFFGFIILTMLVMLVCACYPQSYTTPAQIHITPGDHVEQAKIAIDAQGVKHIAGVVGDRVVYYRTRFGEPKVTLTMTMSGSGTNWKQYDPDIAVTDSGTAYLVWVEQRGGPEKYACYRYVPPFPPIGGYARSCIHMDGSEMTTGSTVRVVGRGEVVYATYDRIDSGGGIADLWYQKLTPPSNVGRIYGYSDEGESGYVYTMDMAIDSNGYLHIAYIDEVEGIDPSYYYRSNAQTYPDGKMAQWWGIHIGVKNLDVAPSLSFYEDDASIERVAFTEVLEYYVNIDSINHYSCETNGCGNKKSVKVALPASWDAFSVISDANLVGIGSNLSLSFIGDDNTAPGGAPQVWMKEAFDSTNNLYQYSGGTQTFKFNLQMVNWDDQFPVMAWMESNISTAQYQFSDFFFNRVTIFDTDCPDAQPDEGDLAANGLEVAGVWQACGETWFAARAYKTSLPLISR